MSVKMNKAGKSLKTHCAKNRRIKAESVSTQLFFLFVLFFKDSFIGIKCDHKVIFFTSTIRRSLFYMKNTEYLNVSDECREAEQ